MLKNRRKTDVMNSIENVELVCCIDRFQSLFRKQSSVISAKIAF